jgi:hypothetical protein
MVKKMHDIHVMILSVNSVFTGFFPRPNLETSSPPTINAVDMKPNVMPQVSTDTSESPYESMSAIKIPPRRLLNVVKKISGRSPGILEIKVRVPLQSSFSSADVPSPCAIPSSGMVNERRWRIERSVTQIAATSENPIP